MMYFRLLIIITILTIVSWLVLKLINKPRHFALVMLAWLLIFLVGGSLLYGTSIMVAGLNNS